MAMKSGFKDLHVPASQREAYKMMEAELAELDVLKQRGTWELVPRPADRNVVGSRFTYSVKTMGDGEWY